jgi:flagellar hook assembly protein FlgD
MALGRAGSVSLDVFDPAGRRVRTLTRGPLPAGRSFVRWDGKLEGGAPAPSGVYFIKLRTGDESLATRVVLVR